MNRRTFLEFSTGAGLGTLLPRWALGSRTQVEPSFQLKDVTKQAGIDFRHNSGAYGGKFLPETLGSGCAFLDYDADGYQDILLVNSMDWPGHKRGRSTLKLYKNNRNGTFSDVTRAAGLDVELYGMGVAVGDYDNDGWDDLYVSGLGGGRLFHNDAGKFLDVTARSGIRSSGFGTSCAWLDFDRDGQLDLFLCNYAKWSLATDKSCSCGSSYKGISHSRCGECKSGRITNPGGSAMASSNRWRAADVLRGLASCASLFAAQHQYRFEHAVLSFSL